MKVIETGRASSTRITSLLTISFLNVILIVWFAEVMLCNAKYCSALA